MRQHEWHVYFTKKINCFILDSSHVKLPKCKINTANAIKIRLQFGDIHQLQYYDLVYTI